MKARPPLGQFRDTASLIHTRLSMRERQVFNCLALGKTVSAIARELNLSVKTVSTYRSRIMDKTLMRSNADIISYALENGLWIEGSGSGDGP